MIYSREYLDRGQAYVEAVNVALSAKTLPEPIDGKKLYQVAKERIERLGFSGVIFDAVIDFRMREAQKNKPGRKPKAA